MQCFALFVHARIAAVLVICALVLPACGGRKQDSAATGGSRDAQGAPQPGEAGGTGPARRPVVGAILMQQDQFFRLNESGMRAAAAKWNVDLKVQNAGGALDREVSILDTFVTQKVDAILVSPLDTQASIPALRRASDRGIRVGTYNSGI